MTAFDTTKLSRRDFLKTSALVTAGVLTVNSFADEQAAAASPHAQRLMTGWEHYRGSLGGPWEVWRGAKASDQVIWRKVDLPHCFNARDAVDPDETYYRGQVWYRTNLAIANPFSNGRTLLHFE